MDDDPTVLECVINVSEGRDPATLSALTAAGAPAVLDLHSDPDHHRAVITLGGRPDLIEAAARSVARATVERVDVRRHAGAHPRLGALDVVPFVALAGAPLLHDPGPGGLAAAVAARDRFARWAGAELELPCFVYGPERSLPDVRRDAWRTLAPATGPRAPHPTAGAAAVGARPALVAYNLWLAQPDLALARSIAAALRSPRLRTLGLQVGAGVQVSCNLIAPWALGPGAVFDAVAARAPIARAELVGLIPAAVLRREPPHRWTELGLTASATIEARLEQAGLDGGRLI